MYLTYPYMHMHIVIYSSTTLSVFKTLGLFFLVANWDLPGFIPLKKCIEYYHLYNSQLMACIILLLFVNDLCNFCTSNCRPS